MNVKRELFVTAINLVEIDGRSNIPTALLYEKNGFHFGYEAYEHADSADLINDNFKVELGNQEPSVMHRRQFATAVGPSRSAHALTKDFIEGVLKDTQQWVEIRGLTKAKRILVAEPIAMGETELTKNSWLANYRTHLRRILEPHFEEVDFLPEPFAVFQYYRYGLRHPLVAQQMRHIALVLDFGGGTFDVSVIETTAQGDISAGGRNSRPLAAASKPVGGFLINHEIGQSLLFDALGKGVDIGNVRRALKKYEDVRYAASDELDDLRADHANFVRHYKRVLHEVEKAKIAICRTIANWDLEATYVSPPAYQVRLPTDPLGKETAWATVRLDALKLREIFEKQIWERRLKPAIGDGLQRAARELEGKAISVVLLSGGSSNIGWMAKLLKRDFGSKLVNAELLELQENFQEIVAKGLAVECARRTYSAGTGDFRSVTYNRLCLALSADDREVEIKRYRAATAGLQRDAGEDGVLLPSASILQGLIGMPMRWKVRLSHPPRRTLDYFFMRATFDYQDMATVHNVDHRVHTPPGAGFDSAVQVELVVREDGTTIPKFIYREGGHGVPALEVEGRPFYLDMTFATEATVGDAYIGLDFGSSNSSVSFVEHGAITIYRERGHDSNWRELGDLVGVLPYPVAAPLARFMAETDKDGLALLGLETFEALLTVAMCIGYAEYCHLKGRGQSKLFKGMRQRSAGPVWGLLKEVLKDIRGRCHFARAYIQLIDEPLYTEVEHAVDEIAKVKHGKASAVDYVRLLGILGNVTNHVFSTLLFGGFESVSKQPFTKSYSGFFRNARGPSSPFIDLYEYSGMEAFSEEQVFVCDPESKQALLLTPLMLWLQPGAGNVSSDQDLFVFDIAKEKTVAFKATAEKAEVSADSDGPLKQLYAAVTELTAGDPSTPVLNHISVTKPS